MTLDDLGLTGVKQTVLGRGPEFNEPCGNCMQAAVATVLGVGLDEVPHFLVDGPSPGWWDRMNAWLLAHHGVAIITLVASDFVVPPVVHLMVGTTCRGSKHVVVGFDGRMVWDPHPSDAGLVTVEHIELFVARGGR
jgi:hypothetical protein